MNNLLSLKKNLLIAKVTEIEESKDLSSLALDELIGNLKLRKSLVMMKLRHPEVIRNFKKFFIRKGKFVRQPREEKKSFRQRDEKKGKSDWKCFSIGDCPKPPRNKDHKAFIGGLRFDSSKASTSEIKPMRFVGSSAKNAMDGPTIKVHGSTIPGSVNHTVAEKVTEHVLSPPMSSRSDFVITRKKLIQNRIEESKKPSLKPSLKSSLDYVKTKSRSKTPSPRRVIISQPRYDTSQSRRNSREQIHQNLYPVN
ncbi:hypothetical protein Tco_1216173 [Tanacetum coccineum]